MDIVNFRAHRILQRMPRYRDLTSVIDLPSGLPSDLVLATNELAVGLYINEEHPRLDAILFTSVGLYIVATDTWVRVEFSEIERALFPESKNDGEGPEASQDRRQHCLDACRWV